MRLGARCHEKVGIRKRHQTPGRNLEVEGKSITPPQVLSWSASGACAQKGTRLARGSQKRIGLGLQEEGRHATSTPTGLDREQRLKEGLEEVSGI